MITLGIDLSSQPAGTAACLIEWTGDSAAARAPNLRCTDDDLFALIADADVIGIDAPFGWPIAFANAVANWTLAAWSNEVRDRLRFRETDQFVRQRFGVVPLSVSSDLIALPAMRAMALLNRHGVTDRSGDGRFFEVYPAASLRAWDISNKGYKAAKEPRCAETRRAILAELRGKIPRLKAPDSYAETSDALDSLIASLTARAAAQGRTLRPSPEQIAAAAREGWIHVPSEPPTS